MRAVGLGGIALVAAVVVGAGVVSSHASAPTTHRRASTHVGGRLLPGAVGQRVAGATRTTARHRPVRLRGTKAWRISKPAYDGQIEGYATSISADPGQPVALRVSTTASRFRVKAFRFGWYRGGQARLVWASRWLPGEQQPGPTFSDYGTRTVVADWHDSASLHTSGWAPGVYLLRLVASTGWQYDVPLILRSPTVRGRVVLVAPVATWQAYNAWGGYSLYHGPADDRRAWAVSFDRPFQAPGHSDLFYGVVPVVVQAARRGIPLAFRTDLDLTGARSLAGARAYVSMGHDEYWTPTMRKVVLHARDRGTNLVFLGADTEWWRIRLASSPTGPQRVVVGYRWDYGLDPVISRKPGLTTGPFDYPPVPRPEEALTGLRYECYPVDAAYRVVSPRWWGFAGTHVHAGTRFPHLVGIEADRVYPTAAMPRPMQVLSSSGFRCRGKPTSSQSVYYTTTSGAGVFNAGTLRWTCALHRSCGVVTVSRATERFARRVTANVLRAFARGPAGRAHPARTNLDRFALSRISGVPPE